MPTVQRDVDAKARQFESGVTWRGLLIAAAVHVAIIGALLGAWHMHNFTAGDDNLDGSGTSAPLGGMPIKSVWHTHVLVIENKDYEPLDSARVHLMLPDTARVTDRDGMTMFTIRAGTMFVVRVTRQGYEPLLLRLPNLETERRPREIRMSALLK